MESRNALSAFLNIITKREVRDYAETPIPDEALNRLLQAGRASGSSRNRQPWRFYVVRNSEALQRLAETVYEPRNIAGCQVAIAIVMTRPAAFDAGRVSQNIGLAAWAEGIGTCPNRVRDMDRARAVLDLEEGWELPTILSVGYPARPLRPAGDDPEAILERMNRKPLAELTHWID